MMPLATLYNVKSWEQMRTTDVYLKLSLSLSLSHQVTTTQLVAAAL